MAVGIQILELVVRTATWIFLIALVARFLAQIARASFHNPLAHTIVVITNPVLQLARRIIPGIAGMDIACLFLIWLTQWLYGLFMVFVVHGAEVSLLQIALWALVAVGGIFLEVLRWSMIIVAIGSWITAGQGNPFIGFLTQIAEPFVAPFRRFNLQIGMMDFTYLLVFMVIIILKDIVLMNIASAVQYAPQFRLFIGM